MNILFSNSEVLLTDAFISKLFIKIFHTNFMGEKKITSITLYPLEGTQCDQSMQ